MTDRNENAHGFRDDIPEGPLSYGAPKTFRDEMLFLEAHPGQIAHLANSCSRGRVHFLAELRLWIELGRPDLTEWQEKSASADSQRRLSELLCNGLAEDYFQDSPFHSQTK
jgi:hypothetical protein